jgi:enamine deaminase RidA (YjgF/YER057c/UK114 family)
MILNRFFPTAFYFFLTLRRTNFPESTFNSKIISGRSGFLFPPFPNPAALPNWEQVFSQVITISSGPARTVYISGQVAVDQDQNLIGAGDLRAQAMQAFRNLETALAAAGATKEDVVGFLIEVDAVAVVE